MLFRQQAFLKGEQITHEKVMLEDNQSEWWGKINCTNDSKTFFLASTVTFIWE